jgi:hypothetical protein
MGFDQQVDRAGNLQSCKDLLRFQALFSRHFAWSLVRDFGAAGERAASTALRRYGLYRGGLIKTSIAKAGVPLTARSVVEYWDMADYHMGTELGTAHISGSDREVTATITSTPEWTYWKANDSVDLARLYYSEVLPGIASALGARATFDVSSLDLVAPWSVTWTVGSAPAGAASPVHSRIFDDNERATEMARRTSMNNGALYFFCADEETKRFDMLGEGKLREAVRALAHERADGQIESHTEMGWELNVETLMDHWDGQLVSIWQFAPGTLTEGTWHQDCTWCPYAAAWGDLGKRALDLGYLYDYELHPTYYKRYNPEMIVQFESIKTRGDAMCKFRISLPSKQKPGEPSFAGYTGKDTA